MGLANSLRCSAKQVGWLVALWTMSVISLGIFAMAFRLLMSLAGMTQ